MSLIFPVLLVLKVTGVVDWSWWWVILPILMDSVSVAFFFLWRLAVAAMKSSADCSRG